ncbi:MAG TPA: hypothetical protein VFT99_06220, partial [Roseiflexaceae bacterium]|nr:hypothetical protein [Roseiflexaceae bacterium]
MITQLVSNETPAHIPAPHTPRHDALLFVFMCAGLLLFYLGSHTIGTVAVLAGLAVFALLAFIRPRLALLFVPLTVPFYLMPAPLAGLQTASGRGVVVPIHEAALVLAVAAWFARGAWRLYAVEAQQPLGVVARGTLSGIPVMFGWRDIPIALFLVGSLLGLATAIVDGPALR